MSNIQVIGSTHITKMALSTRIKNAELAAKDAELAAKDEEFRQFNVRAQLNAKMDTMMSQILMQENHINYQRAQLQTHKQSLKEMQQLMRRIQPSTDGLHHNAPMEVEAFVRPSLEEEKKGFDRSRRIPYSPLSTDQVERERAFVRKELAQAERDRAAAQQAKRAIVSYH